MARVFVSLILLLAVSSAGWPELKTLRDVPSTLVYPLSGHVPFGMHRGNSFLLSKFTDGATQFDNPQDMACVKLDSEDDPEDEFDDVQVTVYGVNSGRGEIIYNTGLLTLKMYGRIGTARDELYRPVGLAASRNGDLFVADSGNHRVVKLHNDGKELRFAALLGKEGKEPGQFKSPNYLALDSQGNLYVVDSGNGRLQVFDARGRFKEILLTGLEQPRGIAVCDRGEAWNYHHLDSIFLVEDGGRTLSRYSLRGKLLGRIEAPADTSYTALACDYYSNVFATDPKGGRVNKYSKDFEFLAAFGTPGEGDWKFNSPRGIAINKRRGQVFIAEKNGAQYLWIGTDILNVKLLRVPSDKNKAVLRFSLSERSLLTIELYQDERKLISFLDQEHYGQGPNELVLDLLTDDGPLRQGRYQLRLQAMATYSSRERLQKVVEKAILVQ
jgi:DNA-binding beta-propeller fold protein YncE